MSIVKQQGYLERKVLSYQVPLDPRNETRMDPVRKKFRRHPRLPVHPPVHLEVRGLLVFVLQRTRIQGMEEHHGLDHEVHFGICAEEKGYPVL